MFENNTYYGSYGSPVNSTKLPRSDKFNTTNLTHKPGFTISPAFGYDPETFVCYKVLGPYLEASTDVSTNGEVRYYHIGESYYFDKKDLSLSYGFHFYKDIDDCYLEYITKPIARIFEVKVKGEILQCGAGFVTNIIEIGKEVKRPFKKHVKDVNLNIVNKEEKK